MNYYLDCEFNGYKGKLISMALVREDSKHLYLADMNAMFATDIDAWVKQFVVPIVETDNRTPIYTANPQTFLEDFFSGDEDIVVHVDWPDDIKYLSEVLLTGPGTMINIPTIKFVLHRVDAYPSIDKTLVQHNALDDAFALRLKLLESAAQARLKEKMLSVPSAVEFGKPTDKGVPSPTRNPAPNENWKHSPLPIPPVRPQLRPSPEDYSLTPTRPRKPE